MSDRFARVQHMYTLDALVRKWRTFDEIAQIPLGQPRLRRLQQQRRLCVASCVSSPVSLSWGDSEECLGAMKGYVTFLSSMFSRVATCDQGQDRPHRGCGHGFPKILQSDCGTEFVAEVIKCMVTSCGLELEQRLAAEYHPRANGLVEKAVGVSSGLFHKLLRGALHQWPIFTLRGARGQQQTAQAHQRVGLHAHVCPGDGRITTSTRAMLWRTLARG
jgi:hypothetical protein